MILRFTSITQNSLTYAPLSLQHLRKEYLLRQTCTIKGFSDFHENQIHVVIASGPVTQVEVLGRSQKKEELQ